jgi:alkylation response protein AidB-like acyl-CoA dehydrogenase
MHFGLNDDQRMLADTLERFLRDNYPLEKRHEFAAHDENFSRDMWTKFAELGVIGAMFDEDSGGFGGSGSDIAVLFEALGKSLVVEPFLPNLLAGSLIAELGSADQKKLLEQAISGEKLLAFAHGEPTSRYELEMVEASVQGAGNGTYRISGSKSVVLAGGAADMLVVSARLNGQDAIKLFLVDARDEGVARRNYNTIDGYGAAEILLDNAEAELLGKNDNALPAIEKAHARGCVAICAECLGAMEIARDLTVQYMHERKQFGVPIGKFQALAHRMADILIEIEQMRSAVINAAGHLEAERKTRERYISAAKHLAGRTGRHIAEEVIQIHGGMGMTWEYPVGHFAKRIVMIDHLLGDTDHHLTRFIEFTK